MIQAIICDFDGTLVDTFEANYLAYQQAFAEIGFDLTRDTYRACFGLRYDKLIERLGLKQNKETHKVRELKAKYYPLYFEHLKVNQVLVNFIRSFHNGGSKTAIASTARRENLMAALKCIGAMDLFDVILAGDAVEYGKPDPEIYLKALDMLQVKAEETICFEDTEVGVKAAIASGARCIQVTNDWFKD